MLKEAAKELQAIMNQVMSDRTLCFLCRSAAVGAFTTNFHINDFSLEDMSTRPEKLHVSWKTVCKTVRSFEYPSWAACGAGAETHINLKEMVSRCLDKVENALIVTHCPLWRA